MALPLEVLVEVEEVSAEVEEVLAEVEEGSKEGGAEPSFSGTPGSHLLRAFQQA